MDDADVVAAIAAGELDGLAVALGRYAAALYDYCYATAPALAAEAVHDTFVIAWCQLADLRDPADLFRWLEAVAGNECFRRTLAADGAAGGTADGAAGGTKGETAGGETTGEIAGGLPPGLPGQVLSACADNTPAGRAYRVSLTHRAGPFGPDGFPRAGRWRRGAGRQRRGAGRQRAAVVLAVAVAAALVTAVAFQPAGDSRHDRAVAAWPDPSRRATAGPAVSGAALPTTPASRATLPAGGTTTQAGQRGKPRNAGPAVRPPAGGPPGSGPAAGGPAAGGPAAGGPAGPPVPMAAVSPAQGVLTTLPAKLVLVLGAGRASAKTLLITATGGPVAHFTIAVPPGLAVSPSSGSLANGASAAIMVSATRAAPFTAALALYPGGAVILVVVKNKG